MDTEEKRQGAPAGQPVVLEEKESRRIQRTSAFPFILSAGIVIVDQLLKSWIVARIPVNTIGWRFFPGDFLRIIHVKNNAVAFSLGSSLPDVVRLILFIILPLILMVGIVVHLLRSDDYTRVQRWFAAGMIGGGIGNLIDRIFRGGLVVDFVDVRFYGLLGMERFPTFNLADSSIVVFGILLVISFFFSTRKQHE